MAEIEQEKKLTEIQVKLPPEISPLFDDLKVVRAKELEPLTNTSIVIDAVKEYHRKRVTK
jgi:hypothetical protein